MADLLDSERAFAENYIICLRKDLAAIKAGFSEANAAQIGWQVYNRPHVKAYIESLMDEATVSAKETLKLISDTAKGNMSNYMNPVEKLKIPQVRKGLQQIIDQLQYEIEIESEFLDLAPRLTDIEKLTSKNKIRELELDIIRYDIELNKNPNACRIVAGDAELVCEMELDLFAIVNDKEHARIKSFKHTKDGVQIEMCDPDTSKDRLARIHGLYEKDNDQKKGTIEINIDNNDSKLGE